MGCCVGGHHITTFLVHQPKEIGSVVGGKRTARISEASNPLVLSVPRIYLIGVRKLRQLLDYANAWIHRNRKQSNN